MIQHNYYYVALLNERSLMIDYIAIYATEMHHYFGHVIVNSYRVFSWAYTDVYFSHKYSRVIKLYIYELLCTTSNLLKTIILVAHMHTRLYLPT